MNVLLGSFSFSQIISINVKFINRTEPRALFQDLKKVHFDDRVPKAHARQTFGLLVL